jgi:four helix bundle protein
MRSKGHDCGAAMTRSYRLHDIVRSIMHPYQKLAVWQRAHALAASLYHPGALRASPRYRALVDQIRRCAASIAANIAEGAGSESQSSFARYLGIALASAYELESHFTLARNIGCTTPENGVEFASSVVSVKRMLTALHRALKSPKRAARNQNGDPNKESPSV